MLTKVITDLTVPLVDVAALRQEHADSREDVSRLNEKLRLANANHARYFDAHFDCDGLAADIAAADITPAA